MHVRIPDRPPGACGSIQEGGDIANPLGKVIQAGGKEMHLHLEEPLAGGVLLCGVSKTRRGWGSDSGGRGWWCCCWCRGGCLSYLLAQLLVLLLESVNLSLGLLPVLLEPVLGLHKASLQHPKPL